jgi:hypothetical protein
MASDLGLGDIEAPFLDVQPGDGTTAGTLTATAPDGTGATLTVVPGTPAGGVVRLTGEAVTFTQAGRWVLHWVVTGTGASEEDVEVYVVASPLAGGPAWTPGRSRVATVLPGRTLPRDAETHELTFNSTTLPTGVQVDRLIADAVRWVLTRTGEVDASFHEFAASVAAVRAAMMVERGYPAESAEQSLARARDLEKQAASMLDMLVFANRTPDTQGNALTPLWSFPTPVAWGDDTFI